MFFIRSAFWLTIGFLLVAPHGTDFGAAATNLRDQAVEAGMEAGSQLIVGQVATAALPTLIEMSFPKQAESAPSTVLPVPVVMPRPRPAALS